MKEISLHLLDIIQNSITAGANDIEISIIAEDGLLKIKISDNGKGMSKKQIDEFSGPFGTQRTTRRVGLGIPLLSEAARRANGMFNIESVVGKGTKIEAQFSIENIDRQPLGDIGETIQALILTDNTVNFRIYACSIKGLFEVDSNDLRQELENVSLANMNVLNWIVEYINQGIKQVFGGVLNEINS